MRGATWVRGDERATDARAADDAKEVRGREGFWEGYRPQDGGEAARQHRLPRPCGTSDDWHDHFRWDGYRLIGQTPFGMATCAALELNHPRRIQIRQAEELFHLFPSNEVGR